MEWVQVANDANTSVLETLVITQSRHGAFPEPQLAHADRGHQAAVEEA